MLELLRILAPSTLLESNSTSRSEIQEHEFIILLLARLSLLCSKKVKQLKKVRAYLLEAHHRKTTTWMTLKQSLAAKHTSMRLMLACLSQQSIQQGTELGKLDRLLNKLFFILGSIELEIKIHWEDGSQKSEEATDVDGSQHVHSRFLDQVLQAFNLLPGQSSPSSLIQQPHVLKDEKLVQQGLDALLDATDVFSCVDTFTTGATFSSEFKEIQSTLPFYKRAPWNVLLPRLAALAVLLVGVRELNVNWNTLKQYSLSLLDWFNSHLYEPVDTMVREVFLNEAPTIIELDVIADANESLQAMIENFSSAKGLDLLQELVTSEHVSSQFNIGIISDAYEAQLQQPLRNLVFGDIIQLILIQVQTLKLQGLNAMAQLDRLLKENQFNTQLLTLAPGLLVLFVLRYLLGSAYAFFTNKSVRVLVTQTTLEEKLLHLAEELILTCPEVTTNTDTDTQRRLEIKEGRITYLIYDIQRFIEAQHSFLFQANRSKLCLDLLQRLLLRNGCSATQRQQLINLCISIALQ